MTKLIRRVIVLNCMAVQGCCSSRCFCLMNLAAGTASQNANDAPAQEKTQHPGLKGRDKYCPCMKRHILHLELPCKDVIICCGKRTQAIQTQTICMFVSLFLGPLEGFGASKGEI